MKCLILVTFSLCVFQVSGFFMNHTCYTIRNATGYEVIKNCIECFKKVYPNDDEPDHVDKLPESAHECIKQLSKDFLKCLSQEKEQKDCLEVVSRKRFSSMSNRFWHHYQNTLTAEEKCQFHQYLGFIWYTINIKRHSEADWKKIQDVVEPCRKSLLDKVRFGRDVSPADEDANKPMSSKEASEEENQMEEADRLRHNIGLVGKYSECMLSEVQKNADTRKILIDAIEGNCHNVPLSVVKAFYDLKQKA